MSRNQFTDRDSGMILVTGASGLLGANLVLLAQEQGREVVGLYHRRPIRVDGMKLLPADLANLAETERILKELEPSTVVH